MGWLASLQPQHSGHSGQSRRAPAPRPHLIVVPASTLSNWQNELQRFCPAFTVVTYHGSQLERSTLRHELRGGTAMRFIYQISCCIESISYMIILKF